MQLEVHILSHDGEEMLEWALRHYSVVASKVFVHDGGPKGTQSALCAEYGAEVRPWDTAGQLNDELARHLKNECWRGTTADWVACVDADELVYFPKGGSELDDYERLGASVARPHGFEMFSDYWFEPGLYPEAQIYDLVHFGAPEDKWYSKPVLFSPKRVADSGFGIGAHESVPVLKNGRRLKVDRQWLQANPPYFLLHFHQIGPIERVAERYDATRRRLSALNVQRNWGNFKPGAVHAQEKRDLILPNLRRVIP